MKLPIAAILISAAARALKVAVLSDVHIMPNYDPLMNNTCYCTLNCTDTNPYLKPLFYSNEYAPLGRIFCDSSLDLAESMLRKLKADAPDTDLLFVTGDIVGHGYAQELSRPYSESKFEILKQVHRKFSLLAA